jgi:hypothetical protein
VNRSQQNTGNGGDGGFAEGVVATCELAVSAGVEFQETVGR